MTSVEIRSGNILHDVQNEIVKSMSFFPFEDDSPALPTHGFG
jgi:hypothetical protein